MKHFWKVRLFYKDVEVPIDINCGTRKEARTVKRVNKSLHIFHDVKMFKVIPFTYPNPLVSQKGLEMEYLQEVR